MEKKIHSQPSAQGLRGWSGANLASISLPGKALKLHFGRKSSPRALSAGRRIRKGSG
jgi:hypothetical protein